MESIPRRTLNDQLDWALNFRTVVTPLFATYGLTLGQITTISALVTAFQNAFALAGVNNRIAVNPAGYTQPGRAALYNAARNCIDTLSAHAVAIQADTTISDAAKINAGIVPRNFTRTPQTLPVEAPILEARPSVAGVTRVRAGNAMGGFARPEEANAILFEFAEEVFNGASYDRGPWVAYSGLVTGNTATISNPSTLLAQRIACRARYGGTRGQKGPWSLELVVGNS